MWKHFLNSQRNEIKKNKSKQRKLHSQRKKNEIKALKLLIAALSNNINNKSTSDKEIILKALKIISGAVVWLAVNVQRRKFRCFNIN